MDISFRGRIAGAELALAEGRSAEAEALARSALASAPGDLAALRALGRALILLERFEEAIEALRPVARAERNSPMPRLAISFALVRLGRTEEAIAELRKLLDRFPAHGEAWFNLGNALRGARRLEEAARAFRRSASLLTGNSDSHLNLGLVLLQLGRLGEAESALRAGIERFPRDPELHNNLGQVLCAERRWREAREALDTCIALAPGHAGFRITRAVILAHAGAAAEAEAEALSVLSESPGYPDAHFFLAGLYLSQRRFDAGWREYRWRPARIGSRIERGGGSLAPPALEALRARPIVLCGEQGLGDTLFFLRFAPALIQACGSVGLEVDPRLAGVLPWPVDSVRPGDAVGLMVGDLPAVLGASTAPPLALRPDAVRAAAMAARLARCPSPRIGLSWEGGVHSSEQLRIGEGLFKRIEPQALGESLVDFPGSLISLQRNPAARDVQALREAAGKPVHDFSDVNKDLGDALALLHTLDEYIAVSNTNVHLHAGLRRTTRVLVTHPCEWRWSGEDRSPWFPDAIVYREDPQEGWGPALARLRRDLGER